MSGKTSQIFGVILFVAVGVSAIYLGVKQYSEKVNAPFAPDTAAVAAMESDLSASVAPQDDPNSKVDTDGDGLTDYQEVHVYHTSPYLADTDSDGIPDGTEVKNGTDPNCAQGQVCSNPLPVNSQIPSGAADNLNYDELTNEMNSVNSDEMDINTFVNTELNAPDANTGAAPPVAGNAPAVNAPPEPTADQIRAMLIKDGLDQASLSGISDQDLIDLYNQSLSETAAKTANANGNGNNNAP